MKSNISELLLSVKSTFSRYPLVLAMALSCALCVLTVILNHDIDNQNLYEIGKMALATGLGIALMFGVKMLSQRIGKQFILEIIGCIILAIFYFVLPKNQKDFTDYYVFVIFPVVVIFHLFVAVAPFFTKNDDVSFWRYNKNLFVNFILTLIFTGVLVGGVELALVAIDALFPIDFLGEVYPSIGSFLAIFGSAFIFLRFNENGLPTLEKDEDYPVVLKFFVQYILIPLLLIYGVILYLYGAKILINWELPKGWVSYLIMSYAVVGILAILLVHPLISSAKSWVKGFSKIFFYTLIPLLVLLFVAIKTRILAYGFTEPRYYLSLIGIWLCAVVAHFVIFRKHTIRFIPMSLLFLGIFGLMCPYFNATAVSVRSQERELMEFLTKNKFLKNGKIDFDANWKSENQYELGDILRFLGERKDRDFILNLLDESAKKKYLEDKESPYFYWVTYKGDEEYQNKSLFTIDSYETKISVSGYDYLIEDFNSRNIKIDNNSLEINDFELSLNSEKVSVKSQLKAFAKQIKANNSDKTYISVPEISAIAEFKNYKLKLIYTNVNLNSDGEMSASQPRMILVKEK